MSDYATLFSQINFEKTIRRYCDDHGWELCYIDSESACLDFEGDSDEVAVQSLFIKRYTSTLEFSVPSGIAFEDEDDIPGDISTMLLKINATNKQGFWCLEKIDDKYHYTMMHNEEGRIIDSDRFGVVIRTIVKECARFEKAVIDQS